MYYPSLLPATLLLLFSINAGLCSVVTRAGDNVTLPCPAAQDTFVLLLEWRCRGCQVPGSSVIKPEVKLVEYRSESVTLFHHETRMNLHQETFSIAFNPVTAQDSGSYYCRVNNRDDSEREIKLIVQDAPSPPGRPLIMQFTSRSVNLSWTPSKNTHHAPITHYIIHTREGEEGSWDVLNGVATITNSTHFTVGGLAPFTVYSFRVVAVNALGPSRPSKGSYYMVTLRELPEGKPVFTAAHNASSTSLDLQWKPPAITTIHGEFLGYKITVRPRDNLEGVGGRPKTITIRDPAITYHLVEDLRTYTQYLVSLLVFNPEGDGPETTVAVMTDEGRPGPPQNLTVRGIHSRSVDLKWKNPKEPNGEIRGYRVYYMLGNFTSVKTVYANDHQITFRLDDLAPDSDFKVWTKAFTQRHEGKSSSPVFVKTDISAPSAPQIVNFTCQTDSSLFLQWLTPQKVYDKVDLYYIYFRPQDSGEEFEEIIVDSLQGHQTHNFLLTNLSANTLYEVKVQGMTYSRFFDENNVTYKGRFSSSHKIRLYEGCHLDPHPQLGGAIFELKAGIIAGIICTALALSLIVISLAVWHRFCRGAYYYLEEPSKLPLPVTFEWQNETGSDDSYGPIDVQQFAKRVGDLHADGDIGFSKEYESIQAASSQEQHTAEHSQLPDNKQKNRYLNIVAYDHSRVPLLPLPGQKKTIEYVNANYIDGYNKARAYIGTQGPLPSTLDTFWRMIWEQRVHIIIMITNLVERGRKNVDQYWPKEGTEKYGIIQVRLVHEQILATYTLRKFAIRHTKAKKKKGGGGERIIYQYHYTNWPDHGTPDHPLPVLSFVRHSAAANPPDAGPIVVHCSAGVGRTGTYIVLDAMLQQIRNQGQLNIWGFLKHIRTQRNFLVQTEEQYIFIHDALLEAIQSGDTNIPRAGLGRYIRMLQAPGGSQEKPVPWYLLSHQYKMVTNLISRDFNVVSAVKPINRAKNRTTDYLPMENGRVHLTPKAGCDGSDYINATWLVGYNRLREFIITQHPTTQTIMDFWQMVWDHNAQTIVVLTAVDESQGFPQFWPHQHDEYDSEHWKVRYLEEKLNSGLVTIDCTVQSLQDDYELPVRVIHAPSWPHTLPALSTALSLVSLVADANTNYQNGPLIVVDRWGGTEAATFCLLTTMKHQIDFEQHLDPYMFFKLYHSRRPGIWPTQDELLFVYRAMETYCSSENSESIGDTVSINEPVIATTILPNIATISPTIEPQQSLLLNTSGTPDILSGSVILPGGGGSLMSGVKYSHSGMPLDQTSISMGNGTAVRVPPDGMEDLPPSYDTQHV
ncbi:unnamed protein product [Meganyctiphanes norvegica]|uniref:protein-tyrosine-phosphatase n=1 Tax=Meganyctiphanes norvegica TaxID=48144 RepID=A0AAV2QJ82_MEGNR